MSGNKCFVCTGEIQNGISESDNSSSEENSFLLCQILELSHLGGIETKMTTKFGEGRISYCPLCLNKLFNIRDMLEEMERLEKKVLDEKYSIELQLKDKDKSQRQNSSDQLRCQIVTELRTASIGSMLEKIRKKSVGRRRNIKGSGQIRIMKTITIPKIVCEKIEPISHDELQIGNVMFTVQDQHSSLSNPQSNIMENDHLEIQGEDRTSEEPLTLNMTETSWTPDNEECDIDIKYEIRNDTDMTAVSTESTQPESEHMNFPQENNSIGQISTKLEVDDVPDVTQFTDAQQIARSEGPPSNKNFICGTCGVRFMSSNKLRIHERMHLKEAKGSSTVKNIRRQKGKSRRNTKNVKPSRRPKKCEECGKVLSCHATWTHHVMSVHRGQFKFTCTLCNYGCQQPFSLRKHIRVVHSVRNEDLTCTICDRFFKSKRACSMHMLKCSVVQ